MTDSHIVDDGGPMIVAVEEADEPQALWVRVGPVYDNNAKRDAPGVWVEYQESYMNSRPQGPLLYTPQTWLELAAAVEDRLMPYTMADEIREFLDNDSGEGSTPRGDLAEALLERVWADFQKRRGLDLNQ